MRKKIICFVIILMVILIAFYFLSNHNFNYKSKNNNKTIITNENTNNSKDQDQNIVSLNETNGKNILFVGDSIVYGFLNHGYSWANYINDNYDFNSSINGGVSDYRVSTYDDKNKWLTNLVHKFSSDSYDFVILEGGVNDMIYDTPLGTISNSKDNDTFDVNTFAGGLESYLYETLTDFPTAKVGYIITYYPENYTERNLTWSKDKYNDYVSLTKKILDKWEVPFLDLSNDYFSDLLAIGSTKYLPDYLHLNDEGYKLISPYIYDWITKM